jgi:hypothetical protein
LLRRFLVVAFVATSLQGCLDTHAEKIYVRRVPPTREELEVMPPEPYEAALRRQDAEQEKLRVPLENREHGIYLVEGRRALRSHLQPSGPDPDVTCELDRIRVIQSKNWADVGSSPPPEVIPRSEPPIEENPFAEVPKSVKKKEEPKEGEAAPGDAGDKPDMGGDKGAKKDAGEKGDGTNKN